MSEKAINLIDQSISSGLITEDTYEQIMTLVHKDGKIDEIESQKLSELFSAMKSGKVKLADSDTTKNFRSNKNYSNAYSESIDKTKDEAADKSSIKAPAPPAPENSISTHQAAQELSKISESNIKTKNSSFSKTTSRILEIELQDRVWIKNGSMIAYDGVMNFTREGIAEHGLGKLIKRNVSGENVQLSKAEGIGKLFLADEAKFISIVNLENIPIYVQAQNVLAFEKQISWDIQPLFNIGTLLAGGLFHLKFHGLGAVAFTTSFEPLKIEVKEGKSIYTDAKSTIAWSSGVVPNIRTDISLQTLIGRSSGETVQIKFEGNGFVIVEP